MIFKKIFKYSLLQKFLAYMGYVYILFVCITSKIKIKNDQLTKKMLIDKKPFILAFWHSQLMMVGYVWKSKNTLNMLASSHSDGRFGSYIAGHFNLKNISIMAKNKSPSLRKVFKILNEKNYIGITPDGPRGPNQKVSDGIIKIAKMAKVPIIPIGFASIIPIIVAITCPILFAIIIPIISASIVLFDFQLKFQYGWQL